MNGKGFLSTTERGRQGENLAAEYLQARGYSVVERNWRSRSGEIDIIAVKENLLVFAEVKTLPRGSADMLEHIIGQIKQERIVKTAKQYLVTQRQYSNSYIRFDVLVINMPGMASVWHIENAFMEH